jgi:hypothetical protein
MRRSRPEIERNKYLWNLQRSFPNQVSLPLLTASSHQLGSENKEPIFLN